MDWTKLIEEIEGAGLTQREIAERAGCSQPYVSQLKGGKRETPDFAIGYALVELHGAVTKIVKPNQGEVRAQ